MRRLRAIERRQVSLGVGPNSSDASKLQALLDEVTSLRLQALRGWSAHELVQDRAAESFVETCHALSNKINAKLSRESLELRLSELIETVKQAGQPQRQRRIAQSWRRSTSLGKRK